MFPDCIDSNIVNTTWPGYQCAAMSVLLSATKKNCLENTKYRMCDGAYIIFTANNAKAGAVFQIKLVPNLEKIVRSLLLHGELQMKIAMRVWVAMARPVDANNITDCII